MQRTRKGNTEPDDQSYPRFLNSYASRANHTPSHTSDRNSRCGEGWGEQTVHDVEGLGFSIQKDATLNKPMQLHAKQGNSIPNKAHHNSPNVHSECYYVRLIDFVSCCCVLNGLSAITLMQTTFP